MPDTAITASAWRTYESANFQIARGLLDQPGIQIRLAFFTAASNAADLSGPAVLADLTGEVAPMFGYATGGKLLVDPQFFRDGPIWRLTADNFTQAEPLLEARGGHIDWRYNVAYVVGTWNGMLNPLLAMQDQNISGDSVRLLNGNDMSLAFGDAGILQGFGATANGGVPGPVGPPGPPGPEGPRGPRGPAELGVSDRFDNIIVAAPDDRGENLAPNRDFNDGPIGSPQDPHFYVSASGVWSSSSEAQSWQPPRAAQYDNATQSPTDTAILFIGGQPPTRGLIPLEGDGFRFVVRVKRSPPPGQGPPIPPPQPYLHMSWRNAVGAQIASSTYELYDIGLVYRRYQFEALAPDGAISGAFSIRIPHNPAHWVIQFDGLDIRQLKEDGAVYAQYQWTDVRFFGDPSTRASRAAAVNEAINHAAVEGPPTVFVPNEYLGYDASQVVFDPTVRLVREGQVTDALDAKAYGAVTEDESFAVGNSVAFNAMFAHRRSIAIAEGSPEGPVCHIPAGRYYVADSLWAGYPPSAGADDKSIVIEGWDARLIATDTLSDRVVLDLSNTRRAVVRGLEIATDTSEADAPRIGILLSRPASGVSVGIGHYERVRVSGRFKTAAILFNYSEQDYFAGCEFVNNARTLPNSYAMVMQGQNMFDASSEFITNFTGSTTNIDHYFSACQFVGRWAGPDFSMGGAVRLATVQNISFIQCYFDGDGEGMVGLRCNAVLGLAVTDCHFHRSLWGAYVMFGGQVHNLEMRGNSRHLAPQGAIVKMIAGAELAKCIIRHAYVAADSELVNRFMIDGREPGCDVDRAYVFGPYRTEVSGQFRGRIEVPTGINRVSLTGPATQVRARVVDQNTMSEFLYQTSDYPIRTVANSNTVQLSDANGLIIRGGAGGSPITVTFPDPDPFAAGTVIEFINGVGAAGGNMVLAHAGDNSNLRFFNGTGTIVSGSFGIPRGYGVRAIKSATDIWNIVPYVGWQGGALIAEEPGPVIEEEA